MKCHVLPVRELPQRGPYNFLAKSENSTKVYATSDNKARKVTPMTQFLPTARDKNQMHSMYFLTGTKLPRFIKILN